MVFPFLENGWYIKDEGELSDTDRGDRRKKMSIDSIVADFSSDDWFELSRNPNAIPLLEQNVDKVDWSDLSLNPHATIIIIIQE